MPVYVVLVIDATTGQNGLSQAKEFNNALGVDGVVMTKLDGTAKGGIALAVCTRPRPAHPAGGRWARPSTT